MPWLAAAVALAAADLAVAARQVFLAEIEQLLGAFRLLDRRGAQRAADPRHRQIVFDEVGHERLDQRLRVEPEDRRQQRAHLLDVVGLADADAAAEMHRLDDARKADIAEQRSQRVGRGQAAGAARHDRIRAAAECRGRAAGAWSPPCPSTPRRPACACRCRAGWRSRTGPGSARPRRRARETPAARHRTRSAARRANSPLRFGTSDAAAGFAERQRHLGQFGLRFARRAGSCGARRARRRRTSAPRGLT